jgi:hypothetical protein
MLQVNRRLRYDTLSQTLAFSKDIAEVSVYREEQKAQKAAVHQVTLVALARLLCLAYATRSHPPSFKFI